MRGLELVGPRTDTLALFRRELLALHGGASIGEVLVWLELVVASAEAIDDFFFGPSAAALASAAAFFSAFFASAARFFWSFFRAFFDIISPVWFW